MFWVKRIVEYIPIPTWGRYVDCWQDKGYLTDAASMGEAKVYQVEVTQLIKDMRDKADSAKSVDELKAYSDCIAMTKSLLTIAPKAKARLEDIRFLEEQQRNNQ